MEGSSCRLCLRDSVKLKNVFEVINGVKISDLIEIICCVTIQPDELFSKAICENCLDTVTRAYDLRLMSIINDQRLKEEYLGHQVVVKIETNTDVKTELTEDLGNYDSFDNFITPVILPEFLKPAVITKTPAYQCDKCSTTKNNKKDISHHIIKEHVSENICPICNKKLCSPIILKQHMQRQHSDAVSLKCEQCNEVLKTRKKLALHQDVHKYFIEDESQAFICRYCQTSFVKDQIVKMFRHINYHKRRRIRLIEESKAKNKKKREDSESLVCPHCGNIYRTKQILQQHIKRHFDSGNKYKCSKCPQKFKSWGELFYHNSVHTTERNFICEICSKGFKSKRDLRNHRVRHENKDIKKFQCPHCLVFLKSRYTLNRHILIHTGEKPFSCSYCDKSFTQKNELNKHIRIHVGECTYRCEESGCTEAFRLLAELRLHQEKHYAKALDT